MSGHDITLAFMAATAAMFGICALAGRIAPQALELFAAAAVVTVFTFVSRVWSANSDMPWSAAPWPIQDVVCFCLSFAMWRKHREWWKAALAVCFALQIARHVPYWWGVFVDGEVRGETLGYIWFVNSLFAVELLTLTVAGSAHVAGYVRDRVRLSARRGPDFGSIPARPR